VVCIIAWDLTWHTLTGFHYGGSHTPTAHSISLLHTLLEVYICLYRPHALSETVDSALWQSFHDRTLSLLPFLDSRLL